MYEGAAVMANHGLQRRIKSIPPYTFFTHCHAHALNLVLNKACNITKDCRIFFSNLSGFAAVFYKSTKFSNVLNEICQKRIPTIHTGILLLSTIHANIEKWIEVFDTIIDSDKFKKDSQSIREAIDFKNLLNNVKFFFFILSQIHFKD